jgi:NADPH:quinone reductase-like Zn-dependent oxidoreductase
MTTAATRVVLPGIVEPDGLLLEPVQLPAPTTGSALVAVEASGISYAEQQMRRGRYYDQPAFPFTPGYDLVGTVVTVGPGTPTDLVGRRVAAMTKTGGWATHALVEVGDLVPVPEGVDPAAASTLVVNGITAWSMLHRAAEVRSGQTVLVHGANGGVGTVLSQLAREAGARVIGTASPRHHEALRALGVEPVDYAGDIEAQVRELAPDGVDAVFDHVGGAGLSVSHRLLRRGGALVSYGTAATRDGSGNPTMPILKLIARLAWWNVRPDGRRATFFNVWAGRRNRARFQARTREDLGRVFALLAAGRLRTQVAATFPLAGVADALRLAESRTVVGKVVLLP